MNERKTTVKFSENRFIYSWRGILNTMCNGWAWACCTPFTFRSQTRYGRKLYTPSIFGKTKILPVCVWACTRLGMFRFFIYVFDFIFGAARECFGDLFRSLSHDTDHRENFVFDINAWVYWTVNGQLIVHTPNSVAPYDQLIGSRRRERERGNEASSKNTYLHRLTKLLISHRFAQHCCWIKNTQTIVSFHSLRCKM